MVRQPIKSCSQKSPGHMNTGAEAAVDINSRRISFSQSVENWSYMIAVLLLKTNKWIPFSKFSGVNTMTESCLDQSREFVRSHETDVQFPSKKVYSTVSFNWSGKKHKYTLIQCIKHQLLIKLPFKISHTELCLEVYNLLHTSTQQQVGLVLFILTR